MSSDSGHKDRGEGGMGHLRTQDTKIEVRVGYMYGTYSDLGHKDRGEGGVYVWDIFGFRTQR